MFGMGADIYYLADEYEGGDPLQYDFSDAGATVMDDMCRGVDGLYTIEDAIERFMDEIDYFRSRVEEIKQQFSDIAEMAMENPTGKDWGREIQGLQWSLMMKQETLDMLESDLSMLLGRSVIDE